MDTPNIPDMGQTPPAPDMSDANPPMRPPDQMGRPMPQMPLAQPTAPQAPQAPAQKQPTPQDLHVGIFNKVLGMIGGGNVPQRDAQGKPVVDANGTVQMQRGTTKQLGAGILAGAISGMLAGMAQPTRRDEFGNQDFSGSIGAGAAAGAAHTQAGKQTEAQAQADANLTRQYQTTDHNLKLHAALLANMKLQGDSMKDGVTDDSQYVDAVKSAPPITNPDGTPKLDAKGQPMQLIMGQSVTGAQLEQMMSDKNPDGSPKDPAFHVTRESVLRDGIAPVYDANHQIRKNADGTDMMEYTYTVYNPEAQVALTQQMKDSMQAMGDHSLDYVNAGTMTPIKVLAKGSRQQMEMNTAQTAVNQWHDQVDEFNGKTTKPIDLRAVLADPKTKYLRTLIPQLGAYVGQEPDEVLAAMNKQAAAGKLDPTLVGAFSQMFGGIDEAKWAEKRKMDVAKAKSEGKMLTPDAALDVLTNATSTSQEKAHAKSFLDERDNRAVAVENRKNDAAADKANNAQDRKDAHTMVYARNADEQLVISNLKDSRNGEKITDADVRKDAGAMRLLGDVQMNTSRYVHALSKAKLTPAERDNMQEIIALNEQAGGVVNFGAGGASLSVPAVSAKLTANVKNTLQTDLATLAKNPLAADLMNSYLRTAASVPAYMKALSGTARANKETLDLELANVPTPDLDSQTATDRIKNWQENLDQVSSGYPTNLQSVTHPSALKNQARGPNNSVIVYTPDGGEVTFPNQATADTFKKNARIF